MEGRVTRDHTDMVSRALHDQQACSVSTASRASETTAPSFWEPLERWTARFQDQPDRMPAPRPSDMMENVRLVHLMGCLTSVSGRPKTARRSSLLAVTLDSQVEVRSEVVDRAEPALKSPPAPDPTSLGLPLTSAVGRGPVPDVSSGTLTSALRAPAAWPAAFAVCL